jgi:hypothetical protein
MVEQDTEFITFDGDTITKSDYRNDIIDHYIQSNYDGLTKITDFNVGSEAYHLADLMAVLMLEHREDIDSNYRMSMIHYAEGEFLDNFGDAAGVHREQSSPSVGEVTFTLEKASEDIIEIPADTVVATDDAISFILTDDVTIYPGDLTGTGEVLCEQEGEYTNVLPGTVNIIISVLNINGLTVTNEGYFYDGADIEEDADYRARILNSPGNMPTGSLLWYRNVAMDDEVVATSVHDVLVLKNVGGYDEDIVIYFRAKDETDTVVFEDETVLVAYKDLVELFREPKYDIVGISMAFVPGESKTVLPATTTISGDSVEYLYAVVLDDNTVLTDVKDDIESVITEFNDNACLANTFSPDSLVAEIEDVEGVFRCRIVLHNITDSTYSEVTDNNYVVNCNNDEYYKVDDTSISSRITEAAFTIDLTPVDDD